MQGRDADVNSNPNPNPDVGVGVDVEGAVRAHRDLFEDLTPAQRLAVACLEGPLLVLAGAGSGKTRVITRRVAHLLRRGVPGHRVLAITFTNKAAGEMRSRLEALAPGSGVWVGTFHGICARLMRQLGHLVGLDRSFTIHDQNDRLKVVKEAMRELELDDAGVPPERIDNLISRAKNDLVTPEGLAKRSWDPDAAIAARVYARYQERLREQSAVDFDDLLTHMARILREHPDVRARLDERFQYILVDEYQDTNLAQYAIVRGLSVDHPNVCVTGDPDQSIYAWRGANLDNILEFERDFPKARVVKLERNYRSTKNILRAADALIRHNRKRKPKALVTENPAGAPVRVTTYGTEADEAAGIAEAIREMVESGRRTYADVAVFCRITALTRNLENAFRKRRIPYQVVGGLSFFERQEIKDLVAYLKLATNPKDDVAFARIVNTPPRGLGKTSVDLLFERARKLGIPALAMAREAGYVPGMTDRAARNFRDLTLLVDELTAAASGSAEGALRSLLSLTGYREFLAEQPAGEAEERLANIDELVSAAREYDRGRPDGDAAGFLEEISLVSAVDRWNDSAGSVSIMTLHAAKGLEFPAVFLAGLEQGILPHSRSGDSDEEIEEERRLLFVGITRAEEELRLSHCRVREFRGQRQVAVPSCFIGELPEDAVEFEDRSESTSLFGGRDWDWDWDGDGHGHGHGYGGAGRGRGRSRPWFPDRDSEGAGSTPASGSGWRRGAGVGMTRPISATRAGGAAAGTGSGPASASSVGTGTGTGAEPAAGGASSAGSAARGEPGGGSQGVGTGFRMITAADLAGGGAGARIAPPSADQLDDYRAGVSVLHATYGLGRIVEVRGAGAGRKARIRFAAGEKTFVLAKTPVRLAGGG